MRVSFLSLGHARVDHIGHSGGTYEYESTGLNTGTLRMETSRDAPHDAIIAAGIFAIPVLIALWIVNRMRHPERGFLHALVIASVGFVLVPCVSSAVLILWVRTG